MLSTNFFGRSSETTPNGPSTTSSEQQLVLVAPREASQVECCIQAPPLPQYLTASDICARRATAKYLYSKHPSPDYYVAGRRESDSAYKDGGPRTRCSESEIAGRRATDVVQLNKFAVPPPPTPPTRQYEKYSSWAATNTVNLDIDVWSKSDSADKDGGPRTRCSMSEIAGRRATDVVQLNKFGVPPPPPRPYYEKYSSWAATNTSTEMLKGGEKSLQYHVPPPPPPLETVQKGEPRRNRFAVFSPPPPSPHHGDSSLAAANISTGNRQKMRKHVEFKQGSSAPKSKDEPLTDGSACRTFTLDELRAATLNFSDKCFLGEGGYGRVYQGRLDDGQVVAVKLFAKNSPRDFLVEVLMLSLLRHSNLVNLIGYCAEGDQRLLVYEYMPLGSLEDHLHDLPPDREALDWYTRMKIAHGAARGVEYLHDKANPPVIHRDLKPSNILLGEEYHPKLSDFGLAKLGPVGDKFHVSTKLMGTYGFCAPEYAMTGQLVPKSDVYSFGVVLLELITGRKAMDSTRPHGEQDLVAWARPLFKDRHKFQRLADPRLQGRFPTRGLYQALAIAAMCLDMNIRDRICIRDVVVALSYVANPDPYVRILH